MLSAFKVSPPCPTPSAEEAVEMYAPLLEAATRWVLNPPPIFDEKMGEDGSKFVDLGMTLRPRFPRGLLQLDLADLFTWQERGQSFALGRIPRHLCPEEPFMGARLQNFIDF